MRCGRQSCQKKTWKIGLLKTVMEREVLKREQTYIVVVISSIVEQFAAKSLPHLILTEVLSLCYHPETNTEPETQ